MKKALNFGWTFKKDFDAEDIHGFSGETIDLPHSHHTIPLAYFNDQTTRLTSSYYKTFSLQKHTDKRYFLRFEGVMSKAVVHVNGVYVDEHVGGFSAFEVEITATVKSGENALHVKVNALEESDHPPFGGVVDFLTYGGIYREVYLIERPTDFIEHVLIDGDDNLLNIRLMGNAETTNTHHIRMAIHDQETCLKTIEFSTHLKQTIEHHEVHALTLWSIEDPVLYQAHIHIDGEHYDTIRFGIRTIKATKDGFYLNNKPIFLRGLNRHQAYAYAGFAMPKSAQIDDADRLKNDLACTIVRSSHYPPSKHFLNRADEIGLLVFTELPGWQHLGDEQWKSHALANLRALTLEGYNHPSIVIIGTRINESADDAPFYQTTRDLVKSLDRTRPTGGVRFFGKSQLLEDIYTLNDFSYNGKNRPLAKKKTITAKHHPYLITEFNGHMFPCKATDDEQKRVAHALRHAVVLNEAYGMKGLMGAISWSMNDYNTHRDFGSNNQICYHGVLDIHRNQKYAAAIYASFKKAPMLEVLSMMHIGERSGGSLKEVVVITNLEKVNLYKNDQWIGTYYPDKKNYPHLPHPPIIIDDLIGNQIHENEQFKPKDAARIKNILLKTLKNDLKMSLLTKLQFGIILLKYKLSYTDAVKLYTRYIGGWGEKSQHYRFEGVRDDQVLFTQEKGKNDDYRLTVDCSKNELLIDQTYDVARVQVAMVNAFNERAFYTDHVIKLKTQGGIEIIGPNIRTLQGGVTAIWIRTRQKGEAILHIESDRFEPLTVSFNVK